MATKKAPKSQLDELTEATKRTGGIYLTEDEKSDIASDNTHLHFKALKKVDSQYGERWEGTFELEGKERKISIPAHEDRDKMMQAIAKLVKRDGVAGPLVLTIKEAENGNRWYWFVVPK